MKPIVLIDSSAWLFVLGPNPVTHLRRRVVELVSENLAAMTSPILFELLSGLRTPREAETLSSYLTSLHIFPFDMEEWVPAARWTQKLRRKGVKVKTVDALIAFKAQKHNLTLLHADHDFDRLARATSLATESFASAVGLA